MGNNNSCGLKKLLNVEECAQYLILGSRAYVNVHQKYEEKKKIHFSRSKSLEALDCIFTNVTNSGERELTEIHSTTLL